jgi:hypothetical protein
MSIIIRQTPTWRQREVLLPLRLYALFAGVFSQFGWVFFGFGMIAFWGLAVHSEAFTGWKFIGPLQTAPGVVSTITKTGASENDVRIYVINYTFRPVGSPTRVVGASYTTGELMGKGMMPAAKGMPVTVEYRAGHPSYSRIRGLRSAMFGPGVLFAMLFPAFGLSLILICVCKGRRINRLLALGVPAVATLTAMTMTNMRINHRQVYCMTFAFTTQTGQQAKAQIKTTNIRQTWLDYYYASSQHLPNGEAQPGRPQETLLYDPNNPSRVFVAPQLSERASLDAMGNLIGAPNPLIGIAAAILPSFIMLENFWCLVTKLLR